MSHWDLPDSYQFDGRTVRYGIRGSGSAVVLVHGTPWSSFNLRHLIEGLSHAFRVYYYDLPGYGQSDMAEADVSLGIQNQVLDALLDHWQLEKPAIIGHDFGGATVLRTHLINQREFSRIVLIDPVAISPWGSPFFRHVRMHEAAFAGVPDYIHEAILRAYIKTAAFRPLAESTLDMIIKPWASGAGKAAFYRQIAQADSLYTEQVEARYSTITTPVLILWGRKDSWIPIERGEALHRMIPGSLFQIIPQSGHLVIEEAPEQLLQAMLPFLK